MRLLMVAGAMLLIVGFYIISLSHLVGPAFGQPVVPVSWDLVVLGTASAFIGMVAIFRGAK